MLIEEIRIPRSGRKADLNAEEVNSATNVEEIDCISDTSSISSQSFSDTSSASMDSEDSECWFDWEAFSRRQDEYDFDDDLVLQKLDEWDCLEDQTECISNDSPFDTTPSSSTTEEESKAFDWKSWREQKTAAQLSRSMIS